MFYLLQSIWMAAAAGIIIPGIIHFWNRKQSKILKIGSISLLTQSYKQQAKSLQLQERLLLLLRCLLILLIALLLSHPVWEEQPDAAKRKGWVMMEKQGLQETYARFKPVIDSLIMKENEFHYFDAGFEKQNLKTILKNKKDSFSHNNASYWSLLTSLDQQVPATLPVYLFTTNSLKSFTGDRPKVAVNLQWYTYTSGDSVSEWLAKTYLTTADSIRLITAASNPSGTAYFFRDAPFASQNTMNYTIQTGDNISVSYKGQQPVTVDTTTLKITIFTDKYPNDAAYVKAAFEAIRQYSKRKINVSLVNNYAEIPLHQDWVFWLSDQPVPAIDAGNIFMYEKGKAEIVGSSILTESEDYNYNPTALYKRILYQPYSTRHLKTIWQDGFGDPLLDLEKARVPVYHFFSRFDPSWNDLAWNDAFPGMMYNLIRGTQHQIAILDNRIIAERQLQPIFSADNKFLSKKKLVITYDLSEAFLLAALLVFFIERTISFKTKMEKTNA